MNKLEQEEGKMEKVEQEEKAHEFVVRDELAAKREEIKTFDELTAFLQDVEKNYNYDYGVAPRAMAQASLAVAWYLADKFGITGFQAGCVMWDFIMGWNGFDNECGMKLMDYDKMLYPQYSSHFEKIISSDTWKLLQEQAKKLLESCEYASPTVTAHWQSIVDGVVPFGYKVSGGKNMSGDDPVINMTVKELKNIVSQLPDDISVIIPVTTEEDANCILGFRHVRTAGLLESGYEDGPALCLNSSENGLDMDSQMHLNKGIATCTKVLF